jgi:hypothetical protein
MITPDSNPTPWKPIINQLDLKYLGKLAEELTEAATATCRCIIQGIDEKEPETGKLNRIWLEEEIADVLANIELVISKFNLNGCIINKRKVLKINYLSKWHNQL